MYSCCPAASLSQFDPKSRALVYLFFRFRIITTDAIGIDTILIAFDFIAATGQKRKVDLQLARRPISHRAHVPVATMSAGDHHVLTQLRVEHFGVVPDGRDWTEKFHDLRLAQIM